MQFKKEEETSSEENEPWGIKLPHAKIEHIAEETSQKINQTPQQ